MLSTFIIGGGPGGLGPLVWAAQHGLLPSWLDRGVAIVDRQDSLGGTLGRFGINSDSLGGSYLECLDAPGLPRSLQRLRFDSVTHEMARYRDGFPPLMPRILFVCDANRRRYQPAPRFGLKFTLNTLTRWPCASFFAVNVSLR